jgi:hypothetical protein
VADQVSEEYVNTEQPIEFPGEQLINFEYVLENTGVEETYSEVLKFIRYVSAKRFNDSK